MHGVFVIVVLVVLAGAAWYGYYTRAQRRKMLCALGAGRGLSFDASQDSAMDERFAAFSCLCQGDSRYAYNVMTGRWGGLPIIAFDYHYGTGSGKNRSEHYFSAVIAQAPVPLRPLFIRREGLFDKVAGFFGAEDINFESAEFSRQFYVKSSDKRWAYDVIHPRMMEYLMAAPRLSVQFDTGYVITWGTGVFSTDQFQAAASHVQTILGMLPEYLLQQQRAAAGT